MYSKALQKLQGQFTGSQASGEPDVLAYSAFVLALYGPRYPKPTCNG
jgi:hypothetical protein